MPHQFPYYPLISEVYETQDIAEAAEKVNKEGFVVILIDKDAEAAGLHHFCLGKIDPSRAKTMG